MHCIASARTPPPQSHSNIRQPLAALTPAQQAAVRAETAVELKTNRYDAASNTLQLTAPETAAYRQQIGYWTDYFRDPRATAASSAT